jgi:hypothetical protein
MPVVS